MTVVAAQAVAASPWEFHLHVDVVAMCIGLLMGYALLVRRLGHVHHPRPDDPPVTRKQIVLFVSGVAGYYLAVGWPLHDLAENSMYSAHMVQHVLIGFVVPPLLLLGVPQWMLRAVLGRASLYRSYLKVTGLLLATIIFNAATALTHWPWAVDTMLRTEVFHIGIHLVYFAAALVMWSPVCSSLPEVRERTSEPVKMAYLFVQTLLPTIPGAFLTFGEGALYPAYESMPRLWGLTAQDDMQLAGVIMKIGVGLLLWIVIATMFFRWAARENVLTSSGRTPSPETPSVPSS